MMTESFVSAAQLMGRVLGYPDYDFAVIEHPISSADGRVKKNLRRILATGTNRCGEYSMTVSPR